MIREEHVTSREDKDVSDKKNEMQPIPWTRLTPLFARRFKYNSPLERHLIEDHYVDEGFRFGADRYYQLEAHKAVHDEDRTPLHPVGDLP